MLFTQERPEVVIRRVVPFEIEFRMTPPAGWTPAVREALWYIGKAGIRVPRDGEIAAGNTANGKLTIERSGKGAVHRGAGFESGKAPLPKTGLYRLICTAAGLTVVLDEIRTYGPYSTELPAVDGMAVDVIFGLAGTASHIAAPIGWTLEPIGWELTGVDAPPAPEPKPEPPPSPPPVDIAMDTPLDRMVEGLAADLEELAGKLRVVGDVLALRRAGDPRTGTAWVIEMPPEFGGPRWWAGSGYTFAKEEAVYFLRRADAEKVIASGIFPWQGHLRAVEIPL